MAKILNFSDFNLNESLIPGGWPSDWKSMPEWETLQNLGFQDATTPLQARNATIMLKNDRIPIYPEGVVLQKSGYIRNKGVTSGFIKNLKEKPYSLKFMFDYLIGVYSDWVSTRVRSDKHGELSDEAINFISDCIKTKNWRWNPSTRSIDVDGAVKISYSNLEILGQIKFGKVKGSFDCSRLTGITDLSFSPDYVGGDFSCYGCKDIRNLIGAPSFVKGDFNARGCTNLVSIDGAPEHVGRIFRVNQFTMPGMSIENLIKVFEGYTWKEYTSEWEEIKESQQTEAMEMVIPLISEERLDQYFSENPLDLYMLDDFPDMKAGVLRRTGIRDLSLIGRNLKKGSI
jgi:hypothetical protein